MDKRILLGALVLCGAGFLYKRSAQGMKGSSSSSASLPTGADFITLISSDGKEIVKILRIEAEQSPLIAGALRSGMQQQSGIMKLEIPKGFLEPIVELLKKSVTNHNFDKITVQVLRDYDVSSLVLFAQFLDYLGLPEFMPPIIQLIIIAEYRKEPDTTISLIKRKIVIELGKNLNAGKSLYVSSFLDLVNKNSEMLTLFQGFRTALNIDNLVIDSFVKADGSCDVSCIFSVAYIWNLFSMDERLTLSLMRLYIFQGLKRNPGATIDDAQWDTGTPDLDRIIRAEYPFIISSAGFKVLGKKIEDGSLTLVKKSITNAYGLSMIEHKDDISECVIAGNEQKIIFAAGEFAGLKNLTVLSIHDNQDIQLPPVGMFAGIQELRVLNLNHNRIKFFPRRIFDGLRDLRVLNISDNDFILLPENIFMKLDNLSYLNMRGKILGDRHTRGLMSVEEFRERYFPKDFEVEIHTY